MAEVGRVSIRLPSSIRQGEVIRVRSLVIHPMGIVQRDKQGSIIRKNYNFIHTLAVTYNGKEVMRRDDAGDQPESHVHVSAKSGSSWQIERYVLRDHRQNLRGARRGKDNLNLSLSEL